MRLVPVGTLTGLEEVPTYDVLPGILAKRRNNRGLEGITAAADGILYSVMQRSLNNPNRAAADANGNFLLVNPQPGRLGTLGRRMIEGPGTFGFDASLSKAVKLGETKEFQLRIDATDVLNKPILGNPTLDINSANFGRITSATGNRRFSASARVSF